MHQKRNFGIFNKPPLKKSNIPFFPPFDDTLGINTRNTPNFTISLRPKQNEAEKIPEHQ